MAHKDLDEKEKRTEFDRKQVHEAVNEFFSHAWTCEHCLALVSGDYFYCPWCAGELDDVIEEITKDLEEE